MYLQVCPIAPLQYEFAPSQASWSRYPLILCRTYYARTFAYQKPFISKNPLANNGAWCTRARRRARMSECFQNFGSAKNSKSGAPKMQKHMVSQQACSNTNCVRDLAAAGESQK
eukprot:477347-Pyramimonas_sp.AAC.1